MKLNVIDGEIQRIYSSSSMRYIKQWVKKEIMEATESSPEYRHEIAKVFQRANRRIQNIEESGLISPAVTALGKGNIKGYTKFSMRNSDWNSLKVEYAKAVSFLKQPTSTATGTREYDRHLMKAYDLTEDEFRLMSKQINDTLNSVDDEKFVEQYLMRYKDFTGELEQAAADVSSQIENNAVRIQNALDKSLDEQAMLGGIEISSLDDNIQGIIDTLNQFDE